MACQSTRSVDSNLFKTMRLASLPGLKSVCISPTLVSLHWLPVDSRIQYKILLITFKALNGLAPKYLSELLIQYSPSRSLRSSLQNLLQVNEPNSVKYGERAFIYCAPKLWNALPSDMRSCHSLAIFKKKLKTVLFKKAFNL